ncbi:MAG: M18 family aminopeptidase [Oscillospiraceae bacterium]|nr:M18 family aminopeptidase [Oscillospiraceae bacterium]
MNEKIQALMDFLDASRSVYHAVAYISDILDRAGYTHLSEGDDWTLEDGGKYYITRNMSTVIAFRIPHGEPAGFLLSASHSDRPSFKIKENGELESKYIRLSTERYGGMLMAPWMDRPLSVAGRVMVETPTGVKMKLVDIDKDLMIIPNVAIHMNRKVNDGYAYNPATDTIPLLGDRDVKGMFGRMIADQAGGRILGHDLFLYLRQKAAVWGIEQEFISAQALDDLQCAWGCLQGFLNASESGSVPMYCVFDSEEVGSRSVSGADSTMLTSTMNRIARYLDANLARMMSQSFLVSADNAHAIHPNHPELADPNNAPVMNSGIVVKFNASQRYTTDAVAAAVFRSVCNRAGVPTQTYYNRPDIPGGSTLGYVSLTHVSVPTADIGLAQLAMHSCYETAGVLDSLYLEQAMTAYFSSTLTVTGDGEYIIV